ncbi:hypothetical protein D3C71_1704030 [compost metagenome]
MSVFDAAWRIFWPVTISPVSDTMRTLGWLTRWLPTPSPPPQIMLITPRGRISASAGARARIDSGVCSDGLNTRVLPAARAGAIFHAAIMIG